MDTSLRTKRVLNCYFIPPKLCESCKYFLCKNCEVLISNNIISEIGCSSECYQMSRLYLNTKSKDCLINKCEKQSIYLKTGFIFDEINVLMKDGTRTCSQYFMS